MLKANIIVAIHNKNGKGLLPNVSMVYRIAQELSQSTIKMEKGYYKLKHNYTRFTKKIVAIHNKNGKGLLLKKEANDE